MAKQQNYQNHARLFPLHHFVLLPILSFNLIWQAAMLYLAPSWDRAEMILMALVFLGIILAARLQALKAQDRVIRLEEKLRYRDILPPDILQQAEKLTAGQIIALRFASDEELPGLIGKTINGELKNSKEIKMAINSWKGDFLRV